MIVIAGLGNIGNEYTNTRHNIGFMCLDKIKQDYNFPDFKEKPKYLYAKKTINGTEIMLIKPTTYMNLSGEALLSICTFYKVPSSNVIVIHDDLDLETGRIKIKQGGGNGGHNGLKSIDKAIGPNYHRIRIGINHPRNLSQKIEVSDYVLGRFSPTEKEEIEKSINIISDDLEEIISKNV